jgi:phospholipid/cholesterol/gamma-HCH transport system substrate-binding protein
LHSTVLAVRENREELGETFAALRTTLKATSTLLNGNQERFDRILANVETATVEGNTLIKEGSTLVKNVNEKYVDSPRTERILDNVDAVAANVARETPPLLADARVTAENARRFSDSVANEEQAAKIKKVVDDTSTLLTKANATASDAQFMVGQMRKGRGSVGALLMDEQLFDDLQEMVRDLKHNPWKFFWRE